MDDVFTQAGTWLANLYLGYALFLIAGGSMFGVHLAVLVFLSWRRDPRRFQRFIRGIEIVYGLVNPALYLLLIAPTFELHHADWMTAVGWAVLVGAWSVRLWGGLESARRSLAGRRVAQAVLSVALATVLAFFLRDLTVSARGFMSWNIASTAWWLGAWMLANVAALYAIPLAAGWRMLRLAASGETWGRGESFFLLSPRLAVASAALLVLGAILLHLPAPASTAERQVLAERNAILEAADRYRLDPRLLASVLYVVTREHSAPFARRLERVAMGLWIQDSHDGMGFLEPLDLSIGITQIRPTTALAALVVLNAAGSPGGPDETLLGSALSRAKADALYKDYRGVPTLDASWRLPASAVAALRPTFVGLPTKETIVATLFDDRANVEMCGLILALYASQWEAANPAWSIRERPEILATLYQLGFERSHPKANPRPIAFGTQVRNIAESAWMREAFPEPAKAVLASPP